jgi:sulfate/thiosulfate transport system ATP-binding protein
MDIAVDNIFKKFGDFVAVDHVSFEIPKGSLVALLGPSGGGKSTLLRILSGLERPDSGRVWLNGRDVTDIDVRDRGIGFVFQHYALFRHLTVEDNVGFGLSVRGESRDKIRNRVHELLSIVGLRGFARRYPWQLSGGQRQRVALARALAPNPQILLLDEPFGAIDAKVREELRTWLRKLHDEMPVTTVIVTHDQEEAFSVADRVFIVKDGKLEQQGTPSEIQDSPATEFVARFVGQVNVLPAIISNGRARAGQLEVSLNERNSVGPANLVVRTYDLTLSADANGIATVERVVPLGDRVRIHAALDGVGSVIVETGRGSEPPLAPGQRIQLRAKNALAYPVDPLTIPDAGDSDWERQL